MTVKALQNSWKVLVLALALSAGCASQAASNLDGQQSGQSEFMLQCIDESYLVTDAYYADASVFDAATETSLAPRANYWAGAFAFCDQEYQEAFESTVEEFVTDTEIQGALNAIAPSAFVSLTESVGLLACFLSVGVAERQNTFSSEQGSDKTAEDCYDEHDGQFIESIRTYLELQQAGAPMRQALDQHETCVEQTANDFIAECEQTLAAPSGPQIGAGGPAGPPALVY